jgi:type I restriction enzyme M protein
MIVALVDPQPHHRIGDPACGTAGFLIAAHAHILRQNTKPADLAKGRADGSKLKPAQWEFLANHAFTGYDNDADMVKIAIMNLYLHRLEKAQVLHHNPLTAHLPGSGGTYPGLTFDIILANPPFSGSIQKESILADINLPTRDTELLFCKWFIDHLSPAGKAGVIVPAGVLFGSTKGARKVRELLLTECQLHAVLAMPSGIFKPYSGVSTAVLVFEKRLLKSEILDLKSGSVWFYDLTADGFSLDDKRTEIAANDIPDLLTRYPNRAEGPNSYRVPITQIIANDYSLAAGRYKPVTTETVSHDRPAAILREVLNLEVDIASQAKHLLSSLS